MSRRVVIIGAGVIGLSAALECARRGHRVTIIERSPAQRNGCSFGNAGMVVPSHFTPLAAPGMVALGLKWMWNPESPFYIKPRPSWDLAAWGFHFWQAATPAQVAAAAPLLRDLSLASRELFVRMADGMDFGLQERGLLMLCRSEAALEEETHAAAKARALGLQAEVLGKDDLARLEPGLDMDVLGGVRFPQDCHLQPRLLIEALEKELRAADAELLWETEVTGWSWSEGKLRAARTTRGEIAGDDFVLCGGAWSQGLARGLPLALPMQAGKGYSLTLPDAPQPMHHCAILTEARVAVTPMGQAMRFGGTMEIAGLNEAISPRRVQGIIRAAGRYFPAYALERFQNVEPWAGLRPCSPDGLPYLGRTQAAPNLLIATGHAMMGLSLAPVTGQIAGRLLDGEPPGFDLRLLSPDRFA